MSIELSTVLDDAPAGGTLAGTEMIAGLDGTTLKTWLASQLATYISGLIIDTAPATLDTLNELAAALGDDPNFAATMAASLALKAPLASPPLTGTPTAPTAAPGTSTTQLATTAFVAALAALSQPLDSDLTAIAALATTSFGRSFLALVDASAARALIGAVIGTDVQAYSAAIAPVIPSGNWLLPEGVYIGSASPAAPGANSMRMSLVRIRKAVTITDLAWRLATAAASGNVQFAIYAANASTLAPTGAVLYSSASQTTTAPTGNFSVGSVGLALQPGVYWFMSNCDATAATAVFAAAVGTSMNMAQLIGSATLADVLAGAGSTISGFVKSQTFGTWPTLTGNMTTDSITAVTTASIPLIAFKT